MKYYALYIATVIKAFVCLLALSMRGRKGTGQFSI